MKSPRLLAILVLVAATACGRTDSPAPAGSSSDDFDAWADGFAEEWVRASPQLATRSQYFSGAEQDGLDRQLSMIGEWDWAFGSKAVADRAAQARRGLEALDRFNTASLTPQQRTSAAVIRWSLEDVVRQAEFPHYRYVFDQFNGFQLDLISALTQSHPIRRGRDVENYLARLMLVAGRVDESIAEARAAQAAGVLPPRVIIQRMIEQLDGLLKTPARENVFVTTLGTRIASMKEPVSDDVRASSMSAAEKTVGDAIIPAYQRIRAMLQEQLPEGDRRCGGVATAARNRLLRGTAGDLHQHPPHCRRNSRHRAARGGAHRRRDGHDPSPAWILERHGQRTLPPARGSGAAERSRRSPAADSGRSRKMGARRRKAGGD